ncbi:MAG TPA: alpha/beta hydrolase, partial [Myxococcota bacterium]
NALAAGRPDGNASVLTVQGIACATIAAGAGRPVLCVHGLGHDAWDFAPFFVRCSKSASLLALDLPGFGLADKPAHARYDMDLYVDTVLAAARSMSSPPVVVASSLGGHIAMVASMREPSTFSKLLLAAPGGLVDAPAPLQAVLRGYYRVDAIAQRNEAEIVSNSHRIFAAQDTALDHELAARKLAVRRSDRAQEFAVPFSGIVDDVFRHVIRDRVQEIRVPTLIISGERDVVVPPDACSVAARRMGARFVAMRNVGHCPHLEVPDAFADLALNFINSGNDA